jgi:hypothetical protein
MPTYTFTRKSTGEQWTEICTIAEMEEKLGTDSDLDVLPGAPFIGDIVRQGLKKPSDGFRDVLRTIKKRHKGGPRIDATRGINTFSWLLGFGIPMSMIHLQGLLYTTNTF